MELFIRNQNKGQWITFLNVKLLTGKSRNYLLIHANSLIDSNQLTTKDKIKEKENVSIIGYKRYVTIIRQ